MIGKTIQIAPKQMQDVLYKLFVKYKFTEEKAKLLAEVYTESTLVGVNSHGINRLPLFIEYIENGIVKIDAEAETATTFGSIERWDGKLGPGIINAKKCTDRAIELAKSHGMGLVALRNTNHWMRGGTYGKQAADAGCELLVEHFPAIINTEFTASMEENLDKVEEGKSNWIKLLQTFYGPFEKTLAAAKQDMKSVKKQGIPTGLPCKSCDGNLVIKWGKTGEFLACENYPECKFTQNFKKDENGTIIPIEKEEPVESGEKCEKCGKPMVYKHGRYGKFLACSGYPECKHIKAQTTGVKCPEENCEGELVQKISKKGKVFFSCNTFPKCKFATWDKPIPKQCPSCGAPFLLEKKTKKETVLKCMDNACGYSEPLA